MAMKKECQQLKAAKEEAERAFEEVKRRLEESEAGANILQDRMRLYVGEDGVDMAELEQVRRKSRPQPRPQMTGLRCWPRAGANDCQTQSGVGPRPESPRA